MRSFSDLNWIERVLPNHGVGVVGGGGCGCGCGGVLCHGPAVIGHSCCGVSANVLSVCLFVCLFVFFGEANKIK